jgi:hypothetical protein
MAVVGRFGLWRLDHREMPPSVSEVAASQALEVRVLHTAQLQSSELVQCGYVPSRNTNKALTTLPNIPTHNIGS